jgi:hypothetical protein
MHRGYAEAGDGSTGIRSRAATVEFAMADIGPVIREIDVEPAEEPVPVPVEVPEREPEPVGA